MACREYTSLRWNQTKKKINVKSDTKTPLFRLAYSELYITLGTLLRRFPHLRTKELTGRSLEYEDYFAPYRPVDAEMFEVTSFEPEP